MQLSAVHRSIKRSSCEWAYTTLSDFQSQHCYNLQTVRLNVEIKSSPKDTPKEAKPVLLKSYVFRIIPKRQQIVFWLLLFNSLYPRAFKTSPNLVTLSGKDNPGARSSGYGRRLMFRRLWVQIPGLYTGWPWHFFHIFFVVKNNNDVFQKTENKQKEAGVGPFLKKVLPKSNNDLPNFF